MDQTTPTTITVRPLVDPVVETHGFSVNSTYVEATGAVAIFKSRQCFAVSVPDTVK
jgi:hypothetical protein